jgi:hypothetical protein
MPSMCLSESSCNPSSPLTSGLLYATSIAGVTGTVSRRQIHPNGVRTRTQTTESMAAIVDLIAAKNDLTVTSIDCDMSPMRPDPAINHAYLITFS